MGNQTEQPGSEPDEAPFTYADRLKYGTPTAKRATLAAEADKRREHDERQSRARTMTSVVRDGLSAAGYSYAKQLGGGIKAARFPSASKRDPSTKDLRTPSEVRRDEAVAAAEARANQPDDILDYYD